MWECVIVAFKNLCTEYLRIPKVERILQNIKTKCQEQNVPANASIKEINYNSVQYRDIDKKAQYLKILLCSAKHSLLFFSINSKTILSTPGN